MMKTLPKTMHPMTQFSLGLQACQTESHFAKAYSDGIHKSQYWEPTYEDMLDVLAKLPEIAALVYRNTYFDGVVSRDHSLDYSANFCRMLGMDSEGFDELMRLYLVIHSDHEGGNASAHATHLVGSTLSDPYNAYVAGLNALAGPLHGLANQEVLQWIQDLKAKFDAEGKAVTEQTITDFAWETLNAGKVVPGFGHAVLRKTDPRYTCQREYAFKHLPDDELFKIVDTIYKVMPGVLTEHGKTKNPYPNVDSHSGVLLWHYGFTQYESVPAASVALRRRPRGLSPSPFGRRPDDETSLPSFWARSSPTGGETVFGPVRRRPPRKRRRPLKTIRSAIHFLRGPTERTERDAAATEPRNDARALTPPDPPRYYTVLFGVSRGIGALSQVFWDRALGLPLERPKSLTTGFIKDFCEKQ